jgi:hypothetical protein
VPQPIHEERAVREARQLVGGRLPEQLVGAVARVLLLSVDCQVGCVGGGPISESAFRTQGFALVA